MAGGDAAGRPGSGLHYMVGAAFFFSLMTLAVKLAGRTVPSSEIVLVRNVLGLVFTVILLRRAKVFGWGNRKDLLLLRGFAGLGGLLCFFYAAVRLPLADVTVIHYINPVLTAILAAGVLGERLRWREVGALAMSLAGVVLVAQPSFLFGGEARLDPAVVGIAVLGASFSAVAYTTVRKLRETEHPLIVVFYFPLVATPASIPIMAPEAVWPGPGAWLLLLAVGVFTQIAQVLLTKGLHAEPAGRAMATSYIQIVFAAVWGVAFFGEFPNPLAVGGAVLVMAGVLIVAGRPGTHRSRMG
jgi:drug/metabolite transporter (DMT)-like permease